MSRNWNPFKKENTPDSLINENTASPFQCYHCLPDLKGHLRYYDTQLKYATHMINEHPEEWPLLIKTSLQKPKWVQQDLMGGKITVQQQKDTRAAYIKIRAASDVGIAVYVTAEGATSYNRVNAQEPLQYTHVRAMNHAMKTSGRNQGCVRSILNGSYGVQGKALLGLHDPKNIDNGIYILTNKAIEDVKNLRRKQGLAGNGNTLQLDEKYPEDKLPNMKVYHPTTNNNSEPTTAQLEERFWNGSYYARKAMENSPEADSTYQYKCKICHGFFNRHGRSPHWKLGCIPVTNETINSLVTNDSLSLWDAENDKGIDVVEPSNDPFEVTIPTAVVDIPDVKDDSSFWDLVDSTPEMNWTAFSETIGTKVFQKYLTQEDEIKQLTTANQELSQRLEQSYVLINTLEADLAGLEAYTRPKEDSNEESLPSNKAEVLQGIQNAGRASAQEIYREHKKT